MHGRRGARLALHFYDLGNAAETAPPQGLHQHELAHALAFAEAQHEAEDTDVVPVQALDLGRQQQTDRAAVQLQRRIIEATVPKGQEPTASQQQAAVQEAAAEAGQLQRQLMKEADEKLRAEFEANPELKVNEVDRASFKEATTPLVEAWEKKDFGDFVTRVADAAKT